MNIKTIIGITLLSFGFTDYINTDSDEITFYLPGNPSEEQYRQFGETLCKDAGIAIEVG